MAHLTGSTALVTGASRGIGRAVAVALAAHGARVAVGYHRNRAAAEETLRHLQGTGHCMLPSDCGQPEQDRALVEEAIRRLGRLDVVVNNAGIFEHHPVATSEYDDWLRIWDSTLRANLLGPANISFWAARHMIGLGGGRIINISSRGAFRGEPDAPAYGASKAGMNSMGQSMAKSLAPHNIYVFTVAPGWVTTDMAEPYLDGPAGDEVRAQSPLGRLATPEEIAETVLFLARDAPPTMTGCIIDVNGASYLRT